MSRCLQLCCGRLPVSSVLTNGTTPTHPAPPAAPAFQGVGCVCAVTGLACGKGQTARSLFCRCAPLLTKAAARQGLCDQRNSKGTRRRNGGLSLHFPGGAAGLSPRNPHGVSLSVHPDRGRVKTPSANSPLLCIRPGSLGIIPGAGLCIECTAYNLGGILFWRRTAKTRCSGAEVVRQYSEEYSFCDKVRTAR